MDESREFQAKQYEFAAHIRDPENTVAPADIEDRRMSIYRNLFFNNLYNLLGTFFPVLKELHSDAKWGQFIRAFMRQHRARTPYFLQLPEEFLAFLQNEYEMQDDDFPFLTELAHYEYAELALSVSADEVDAENVNPAGDLLAEVPVKSELAWAFAYNFPVHRISPEHLPENPTDEPVYLAIYRRRDDEVGFLELNAVTAALLDAVENNASGLAGESLLRNLAEKIGYSDVDALVRHGSAALEEMRQLEIISGTRPV